MNNWQAVINQYKHYLIVISALLVANYIILPLSEWQTQQQETLSLLSKKQQKLDGLITNEQSFEEQTKAIEKEYDKLIPYLFTENSEARFKLKAQAKIEDVLKDAGCKVERIGFQGSTPVNQNISRWLLELRFKGDSACLVKTTRGFESMKPNIKVESYNFNHRGLKEEGKGNLNAQLSINVWHKSSGEG